MLELTITMSNYEEHLTILKLPPTDYVYLLFSRSIFLQLLFQKMFLVFFMLICIGLADRYIY